MVKTVVRIHSPQLIIILMDLQRVKNRAFVILTPIAGMLLLLLTTWIFPAAKIQYLWWFVAAYAVFMALLILACILVARSDIKAFDRRLEERFPQRLEENLW
jgi:hypothetical protein